VKIRVGRRRSIGRFTGLRDLLRTLAVDGPGRYLPRHWEVVVYENARRMGIRVAARRLGRTDITIVYRIG
jgi:hypothetical protein